MVGTSLAHRGVVGLGLWPSPRLTGMKHSCSIYYYLCVLTNMTNTCTYRFGLSQSDLETVFRSENVCLQKTKKNWGKSVFKVILLQLRHCFLFEVPYVVPWLEFSRWNSKALDQGTYVDLHGALGHSSLTIQSNLVWILRTKNLFFLLYQFAHTCAEADFCGTKL